jgi:radical SAM superfamily enzyme YgiQ (UPF0313 family)
MRVLLINPFYPISETPSPPLGLAFLAGFLEKNGIRVQILDFAVFPQDSRMLEAVIGTFQPGLVGATAVSMNFEAAMGVLQRVKEINPGIVTVCGGPHVTYTARQALADHPELDLVVRGEGEQTLLELVRCAARQRPPSNVPGIVFRGKNGILRNARRAPLDINRLPMPARHLLPLGRYRALGLPLTMTTSRGCPFHCIYCVGRKMGGASVRYREPHLVADELEQIVSMGFERVNIADDLFTANHRHCRGICDEILRRDIAVQWTAFARVDTVTEDLLQKMKAAGCTALSFGVESANPQILKTIRKGITPRQVLKAVEACLKVGVTPYASFILGLPGETAVTLEQTVGFARHLQSMGVAYGFHLLAPFPGTEIRKRLAEFDLRLMTDDWSQYHANRAIVESSRVAKAALDGIVMHWEDEFHAYLDGIKKKMQAGVATAAEKAQIEGLERSAVIYDLMMGGVIEGCGWWAKNGDDDPSDDLRRLAERVAPQIRHPADSLSKALAFCVEKKHLRKRQEGGRIHWQWVDGLPAQSWKRET